MRPTKTLIILAAMGTLALGTTALAGSRAVRAAKPHVFPMQDAAKPINAHSGD